MNGSEFPPKVFTKVLASTLLSKSGAKRPSEMKSLSEWLDCTSASGIVFCMTMWKLTRQQLTAFLSQ
jgi:hypothetical protein